MNLQLNELNDMKKFAKYLSGELVKLGYNDRAKMVDAFSYNSYITSSEYLGEFRIVLEHLIKENILLEAKIKSEVEIAIKAINKAFGYFKMDSITQRRQKELINTLKGLENIIDEMIKVSCEQILIWHKEEVKDWLDFLEKHTDKEELHSLEIEIGDRFFYKYNVRIEPINLDKQRLSLLQKFISQINAALK